MPFSSHESSLIATTSQAATTTTATLTTTTAAAATSAATAAGTAAATAATSTLPANTVIHNTILPRRTQPGDVFDVSAVSSSSCSLVHPMKIELVDSSAFSGEISSMCGFGAPSSVMLCRPGEVTHGSHASSSHLEGKEIPFPTSHRARPGESVSETEISVTATTLVTANN